MSVWYGNNPNCGACGHMNCKGYCDMTACIYPCETGCGGYIQKPIVVYYDSTANEKTAKTNADWIRSRSDDELAEWLVDHIDCDLCPVQKEFSVCIDGCKKTLLAWLEEGVAE